MSTRLVKTGWMVAIAAVVIGASLALLVEPSAAQGPGGRGWNENRPGPNARGLGQQTQTQTQSQTRTQTRDPELCCGLGPRWDATDGPGRAGFGGPPETGFRNLPPAVPGEVPDAVVQAMIAGWLDEYQAYQFYQAVIDRFGPVRPFVNIQRAEAQHMAAHEAMFARYNLELPAAPDVETPVFASLAEACAAARDVESANTALYDEWLAAVQAYPDLTQVFTALRDASLNHHLPAFERCAG